MPMMLKFLFMIYFCTIVCHCEADDQEEDDKLIEHINSLYKDEASIIDPYDMFGEEKTLSDRIGRFEEYFSESKGEECLFEKKGLLKIKKEFELCSLENMKKDDKIKEANQLNFELQKKFVNDNSINIKEFYTRILKHFWTILEMENILDSSEDVILIRQITAKIRRSDAVAIYNYFQTKQDYQQIDDFFISAFESEEKYQDKIFPYILEKYSAVLESFKSWRTWMFVLWGCFIFLIVWCFTLFVIDIQRQMRWNRVIIMMLIILFGISCLIHYHHLIQVKESKRHSYLMQKKGLKDIPDECHTGESWFTGIRKTIFGGGSVCDEYFENMMIEPEDEISPAIVISETASKFVFHPLQHIGLSIGLFFTNFYGSVPIIMIVPVTIVFLVMFVIVVLSYFRYGITLPFWMGSIKPEIQQDFKSYELEQMIKECERKMESNNTKLIHDTREVLMGARDMLKGVFLKTFDEMQKRENQSERQKLVQMSTDVIECQLERLICNKVSGNNSQVAPEPYLKQQIKKDAKQRSGAKEPNVIALRWDDCKDKPDGFDSVMLQRQDFLHQLEVVLGQSLADTVALTKSESNSDGKGSFLKNVEKIMNCDKIKKSSKDNKL